MKRSPRQFIAVTLVLGALVASSLPASAAPRLAQLVNVRVGQHTGFDRVVFDFEGPLPTEHFVRYVKELRRDGSGNKVPIAGRAVLQASFQGARMHRDGQPTAPVRRAYATKNVNTTVAAGEFEAVVSYGIGLTKREPFRVFTLTNPSRVVIDLETSFPSVTRKVFFLDVENYQQGTKPYMRAVKRQVRPTSPATGVMDRLYAGPTPAEHRAGLRRVKSGTTGFADLTISNGIADLRLLGPCRSGGSTFTVANHIRATLKQFPTVDWVKIRDRQGNTADPSGPSDSQPECLEP